MSMKNGALFMNVQVFLMKRHSDFMKRIYSRKLLPEN